MLSVRVAWIVLLFQLSCSAVESAQPLDVTSINADNFTASKNQTKPFGFQDTFNSKYGSTNGAISLFPHGCLQNDGTPNCTAACLNNTQMFSDLETLHNCALFPKISVSLADDSLTPEARRLAADLKIAPSNNDSSLPSTISNAIQHCLLDSCNAKEECAADIPNPKSMNHKPSSDTLDGANFIDNGYLVLCVAIPAYITADVGGVGVFISYVIQMGLALLAFIFTIPWPSIMRGLRTSLVYCLGALFGSSRAEQNPQPSSAHDDRKYPAALTLAIVSFHKAQCFFMLATNIAGLIIEIQGGLAPGSLQQLYNTYIFIKVIAIGGFLPITFTLLNLHMIEQLSWYILILSTVTIAVATATLTITDKAFMPAPEDFNQIVTLTYSGGPPSCASQNLIPWCYNPRKDGNYFGFDASSSGSGADDILIFCLVTLFLIVVDHFCRSDDPRQRKLNRRILTRLNISPSKPLFPHAGAVLHFGTMIFHFVFFWLYIYCFYIFGDDLEWFNENNIYDPSWGFGQLVAILVWAPSLCDYLWDQIRGVPKGSEHKMPKMYEVVKRAQERHAAETTEPSHHGGSSAGAVTEQELPLFNFQTAPEARGPWHE